MNAMQYLNEVYLPDRPISSKSAGVYRNDIRRLEACEGRPVDLEEIDEPMVKRFGEYLQSLGLSKHSVRNGQNHVRAIVRHGVPGRFPWELRPGRPPKRVAPVEVNQRTKRKRLMAVAVGWLYEKFGK